MFHRTLGSLLGSRPRLRQPVSVRPRLELLEDRTAPAAGPILTGTFPAPTAKPFAGISTLTVQFDQVMDVTTFTAADFVSFTGPNGPVTVTNVQPGAGGGNRIFNVTFAAQTAAGPYTYSFGPDIRDATGRLMDQNNNNVAGEDPGDRFNGSFTLYGPRVDRRNPESSPSAPQGTSDRVRIVFATAIDPATFTLADITNFTGPSGAITPTGISPDPNRPTTEFFVSFPPQGVTGNYQFTIGPNVTDAFGNPLDQNQNTITGEIPGDQFVATWSLDPFFAGGPLSAPGTPAGPVSLVRLPFNRPVDTATLDLTDVVSFTGPAGPISVTSVNPQAGFPHIYEFHFAPQTTLGSYTLVVGPNIQDIYGNVMDQNRNGIPAQVPADRFTGSFTIVGPRIQSGPGGNKAPGQSTETVTFTQSMNPSTFTLDDIVFTGPNGPIAVTSVTPVPNTNDRTFTITFPLQGQAGAYTMVIGPDIRNLAGVQLDQNVNNVPGEVPGDRFTGTFNITAPRITAASPGGVVLGPISSASVTFGQDMDTASFTVGDVVSFTGPNGSIPVTSITPVNARTFTINFAAQNDPGLFTLVMGPNILDTFGNPMNQDNDLIFGEDPGDRFTMSFSLNQFGPDPFGYVARPGIFENVNLVLGAPGVVTVVDNLDDAFGAVDLGTNTFNYYGTIFTGNNRLFASTNGVLSFGTGITARTISETTLLQPYIAPFWRNWTTSDSTFPDGVAAGEVLSKLDDVDSDGTADRLIIEWSNVRNFVNLSANLSVTFQAILDLNTGAETSGFTFNYVQTVTLDPQVDISSAVAIKDMFPGAARLTVSPTGPTSPWVGTGKALRFTAPPIGGTISGQKFEDLDRDGVKDASEPALADWQVYVDVNKNGSLDNGEPTQFTDAQGNYSFTNLVPGLHEVAEVGQPLWVQARPGTGAPIANGGFETGDFTGWSTIGRTSIQTSAFGGVIPTEGTQQAVITNQTGSATAANVEAFLGVSAGTLTSIGLKPAIEGSAIKRTLFATAGSTLTFDVNYFTNETAVNPPPFPNPVGPDFAFLTAAPVSGGVRLADSSRYVDTIGVATTGFFQQTGYATLTYTFPETGTYVVGIGVMDGQGSGTDSGMALDNVRLRGTVYPVAVGIRQTVIGKDFGNVRLLSGPASGVRGQGLEFKLGGTGQTTDAFTYDIDWDGNGTVDQTVNGADGLHVEHVYPAAGTYEVRVTSTDAFGNVIGPVSKTVTIAVAEMQTDPGDSTKTALAVGGTTGNDSITVVKFGSNGAVRVIVNGTSYGPFTPTGRVIVYAQDGNDLVTVSGAVTIPAMLFGDAGNDVLDGGKAGNVLVGGAGMDVIQGDTGRDVIIGGVDADMLFGGAEEDLLIGGFTTHDDDESALAGIAAEWARTNRTYEERIAALSTGGGLNGDAVLNSTTVLDDAAVDMLSGGGGRDWFFASLVEDFLLDRAGNEQVN